MQPYHEIICSIIKNSNKILGDPKTKKYLGYQSFLELGISSYRDRGVCTEVQNLIEHVVAVDIEPRDMRAYSKIKFYNCSTDEFFKNNTEKFDSIFIDADHNIEQVKIDFYNSLEILNIGGVIFLHDTDPATKKYAIPGSYCSDAYKIVEELEKDEELNIVNLPINIAGLAIVQRKQDMRIRRWQKY